MATPSAESSKRAKAVVDDEQMNLRIGQYTRLNEIGRGSFATVYRGTHNVRLSHLYQNLPGTCIEEIERE